MKTIKELLLRWYPLLFGFYPVLFYYNHNKEELSLDVLVVPLAWGLIGSTILLVLLRYVFLRKEAAELSATLTTIILFYFYSYHHIIVELRRVVPSENGQLTALLLGITLIASITLIKRGFQISQLLAIFSCVLVMYSIVTIGVYELQRIPYTPHMLVAKHHAKKTPDIYYLVFDRYANQHVLKEHYSFDNPVFLSSLESMGFFVADHSYANFSKTILSMVSSLNMNYLQELALQYDDGRPRTDSLTQHFQDNKVAQYLRARGYAFIYSGDTWGPIAYNPYADKNITLYDGPDIFLQRFLSTTAFEPLARNILKAQPEDVLFSEDKQRANRLYKFEQVKRIASQKGPKFVYMHTLLPHDPYVFNESCQPVHVETGKGMDADYLRQLRCTNMFITDLVDHIQKASGGEAIIVLQSDEGPFMHKYYDLSKSPQWTKLSDEALASHMRILNAYYLPGVDASVHFASDATPVNTFRTIFNLYFNDDFPLLPNNSFLTPEQAESSKYVNITDRVRFNN